MKKVVGHTEEAPAGHTHHLLQTYVPKSSR